MCGSRLLLSFCSFFLFFFFVGAEETACPSNRFRSRIVSSSDDAQLKVLVPNIPSESLRQLVNCSDPSNIRGFCIDVFETALSNLSDIDAPVTISYTCFNFSNSSGGGPDYNAMVGAVANGSYDVVVGDVTVSAARAFNVSFTQQYMESGMIIIIKKTDKDTISELFFFGQPFTIGMWCMAVGAIALTSVILWLLERRENKNLREGAFKDRLGKAIWLIMEGMVLLQRESIKTKAGRFTVMAWVFLVFLLSSSYTARLGSILTANNLSPSTTDILTIKDSNKSIAYRRGSITEDFLTSRYRIEKAQLKAIRSTVDFINNITKGLSSNGVIAIVDELPYANSILADLSCDYGITGPPLTREGFSFAFRHDLQPLGKAVSMALLNLSESGCLQDMQNDHKLNETKKCPSEGSQSEQVSFKNLCILLFGLSFLDVSCIVISVISCRYKRRNQRNKKEPDIESVPVDSPSTSIHRELLQGSPNVEVQMTNNQRLLRRLKSAF